MVECVMLVISGNPPALLSHNIWCKLHRVCHIGFYGIFYLVGVSRHKTCKFENVSLTRIELNLYSNTEHKYQMEHLVHLVYSHASPSLQIGRASCRERV